MHANEWMQYKCKGGWCSCDVVLCILSINAGEEHYAGCRPPGLAWLIHSLKGGSKVSFISQVLYGWGQSGHVAATSLASGCGCHMAGRQVTRLCSMQNCTMVVLGSRTEVWQFIATWWRGEWELDQQQKAVQNSKTSRKDWTSLQWIFISVLC